MAGNKFMVKPVSSASNKDLVKNLRTNMDTIPVWAERCKKTNEHAFIISGGPSTKIFLRDHKKLLEKNNGPIFCIKHALPLLKDAGIIPDFCVVLDPRDINNTSTLGHTRKDLYNCASKETKFFVASMTHPSVTKHLITSGYTVYGWHALTPEMQLLPEEYRNRMQNFLITGGTSSGTRTIELAFFLGIASVTTVGFDSSFDKDKPTNITDSTEAGKGKQRYLRINVGGKQFYSTGELVAQAQDFERIVTNVKHASDIRVFDTGLETSLVNELVKKHGNKTWPEKIWTQLYKA